MRSPVGVLQTAVLLVIGAGSLTANVVVDWNAIAAQNMTVGNTLSHTREFAILHVAIYDAVVSIAATYRPYGFAIRAPKHASAEAAALTAAHDVLVAFHPDKAGSLDARYASDLDKIQDGWAKSEGIQIGRQVAAAVLEARSSDGFNMPPPVISDGTQPYQWRRTAPLFADPLVPQFADVKPWVIEQANQFLPKPPPGLQSKRYARDLNEVKTIGSVMSDSPQEKKDLAFFHLQSHPLFWNDVARQLWNESPRGLAQTARIFACLNAAIMDAYVGAWYAKWKVYFKWRPITAIRLADTDDNDFTQADAGWEALSATPPHPTYPSGHGSAAGAGSYVLRKFFGEHGHALTMMSPTAPGVVLHYSRLRAVTDDVQDARVYLGIHFRFDTEAGDRLGSETGAFVFHRAFRKLDRDDDDICDWEP